MNRIANLSNLKSILDLRLTDFVTFHAVWQVEGIFWRHRDCLLVSRRIKKSRLKMTTRQTVDKCFSCTRSKQPRWETIHSKEPWWRNRIVIYILSGAKGDRYSWRIFIELYNLILIFVTTICSFFNFLSTFMTGPTQHSMHFAMLRPGQTLALAGPEARHYNHPATARPPPRPAANVCISYISAISQRIELKFCMIDI